MKNPINKLIILIPILLLACISLTLCVNQNTTETTTTSMTIEQSTNTDSSKPISAESMSLSIIGTPNLNQTVELVAIARVGNTKGKDHTINLILPQGVELVSGNTTWNGFIDRNESKEIRVKIKAVKPGNWTLVGKSISFTLGREGEMIAVTNIIFLNDTNATVIDYIPPTPSPNGQVGTRVND